MEHIYLIIYIMKVSSKLLFLIFLLCSITSLASSAEVTYSNLKSFWESTYDTDKDGEASLQDFINYFQFM